MDLEKMKHKYAYTLARVGLNVQKGQTVLVEAAVEGWQFTSIFAEECYKLGAGNVVRISTNGADNHRQASCYRFEQHNTRRVLVGRMHQQIGTRHQFSYVAAPGKEVHILFDASLRRLGGKAPGLVLANHKQRRLLS